MEEEQNERCSIERDAQEAQDVPGSRSLRGNKGGVGLITARYGFAKTIDLQCGKEVILIHLTQSRRQNETWPLSGGGPHPNPVSAVEYVAIYAIPILPAGKSNALLPESQYKKEVCTTPTVYVRIMSLSMSLEGCAD